MLQKGIHQRPESLDESLLYIAPGETCIFICFILLFPFKCLVASLNLL